MTFKEIQDNVLLDRFNETQRAAVKQKINSRYGRMWALEPWSFKRVLVEHSLLSGEDEITLAELGLQRVEVIYTDVPSDFTRLYGDRPENALSWASENNGIQGAFTMIGDTIRLDRPGSTASNLLIIGEQKWVPMVGDLDEPLIPAEYHGAIVDGAAADMLLREADPTWQGSQQSYTDQVGEMRYAYMSNHRLVQSAYPSWPY